MQLSTYEKHRTGTSERLVADLQELADRYDRAKALPGISDSTAKWFDGAAAGLIHAIGELKWRLRLIEDEAALVPHPEPVPAGVGNTGPDVDTSPHPERILGSVIEDTAPSFDTLRTAGRNTSR